VSGSGAVEKFITKNRGSHADDQKRLEKERDQLDREHENLSKALGIAADVPELAKLLQERAKRRTRRG
jgi:hypothetical protein